MKTIPATFKFNKPVSPKPSTPANGEPCFQAGEFCVPPPRDGMTCNDPATGALITCPEVIVPPPPNAGLYRPEPGEACGFWMPYFLALLFARLCA